MKKEIVPIPSVNFHLLVYCNMRCTHCFAANLSAIRLPVEGAVKVIRFLAEAGFEKINFAGGELLRSACAFHCHDIVSKCFTCCNQFYYHLMLVRIALFS